MELPEWVKEVYTEDRLYRNTLYYGVDNGESERVLAKVQGRPGSRTEG